MALLSRKVDLLNPESDGKLLLCKDIILISNMNVLNVNLYARKEVKDCVQTQRCFKLVSLLVLLSLVLTDLFYLSIFREDLLTNLFLLSFFGLSILLVKVVHSRNVCKHVFEVVICFDVVSVVFCIF